MYFSLLLFFQTLLFVILTYIFFPNVLHFFLWEVCQISFNKYYWNFGWDFIYYAD